jgi:hypothetical protein
MDECERNDVSDAAGDHSLTLLRTLRFVVRPTRAPQQTPSDAPCADTPFRTRPRISGQALPTAARDDFDVRCISADGHASRADVGSLAVTNVVTAVRSADEAKARPTSAARPDVAGEVVAQLIHLNIE